MPDIDVIVIGGGGAGLSAASAAAAAGARVTLIEKNAHVGGTTQLSVGSFSAAGTSLQRRHGIVDSVEEFVADMATANGELEQFENQELRHLLAANAAETFEWLRSLGVQFFGPTPEPPFTHPRMHNVVPHSTAYITALLKHVRKVGVEIRTGFRVSGLVVGPGGRVIGVDGTEHLVAKRGVILATGDYSANSAMKAEHVSTQSARVPAINAASTGDGFDLARALGAGTVNMSRAMEELRFARPPRADRIKSLPSGRLAATLMRTSIERLPRGVVAWFARGALTSWVAPSPALYPQGAILVDREGLRFADETDPTRVARALAGRKDGQAHIVFDDRVARHFSGPPHPLGTFPGIAYAYLPDYRRFRPDIVTRAATLDALADQLDMPADGLRATVRDWNVCVQDGHEDHLGRVAPDHAVGDGPYWALGPLQALVTLTDGGLTVDTDLRVLRADGSVIDGLFAVGSVGQGGLILRNHGLHIAWALTSGQLAGRTAATTKQLVAD